MKNIYIYITFLFILSTSCGKTVYNSRAQGHIIDATTGQPIAGAWVELTREKTAFLGRTTIETEAKTLTKEDGSFVIDYRRSRGWNYVVYSGKQDYFFSPSSEQESLDFIGNKNLQIKLFPKAELVFDIRNTKGGSGVSFRVGHTRNNQTTSSTGQGTFQLFQIEVEGNKQIDVSYLITLLPNGKKFEIDTSIYCPAFQTTTFTIEY